MENSKETKILQVKMELKVCEWEDINKQDIKNLVKIFEKRIPLEYGIRNLRTRLVPERILKIEKEEVYWNDKFKKYHEKEIN